LTMIDSTIRDWLGDMPIDPWDGQVRHGEAREFRTHTEIKIDYCGHAGERIPAYLLLPRNADAATARGENPQRAGVVAFHQCGYHCDLGKEQVVGHCVDLPEQAYGLELVRRGFVVLAPDAAKVGERFDPALRPRWKCATDRAGQDACCCAPGGSWGHPRWRPVFDAMRAVDVLAAVPGVDPARLGAIGHSLGADTILWTLPVEPRLRAVALSGGGILFTRRGGWQPYARPYPEIVGPYLNRGGAFFEFAGTHDPCHRLDDPRPEDPAVHMAAKNAAHTEWARAHAGRVHFVTAPVGHEFPESARVAAYDFLAAHLG